MNFKTIIPLVLVFSINPVTATPTIRNSELLESRTRIEYDQRCSSIVESSSVDHINVSESYIWCDSGNNTGFSLPLGYNEY